MKLHNSSNNQGKRHACLDVDLMDALPLLLVVIMMFVACLVVACLL